MLAYDGRLVVELHDDEVDNVPGGTLNAHIGRRGTPMVYAATVEVELQDVLNRTWRRAYLKIGTRVLAIWARDSKESPLRYLMRDPEYDGEWELPFVDSPEARVAVGTWRMDAATDDEALIWAGLQLKNAITAILFEDGEIRRAFELVDGEPQLVSRSPKR